MTHTQGGSVRRFSLVKKNDAAALCIVNTAYVLGPPLQHRVLKLSYAFWAPVNTTYVKLTSSGAQPVNIFFRPECYTWLYSLAHT